MKATGFRTNIGKLRMTGDEASLEEFCASLDVTLTLEEGVELSGNQIRVTNYDNDTGMATIMFERSISVLAAEAILSPDDIILFGGFGDEELDDFTDI